MASVYNNLYLDARKQLKHAGIEAAQLEAREIVCFAAGKSRDEFYRDLMLYASDQVEAKVKELVRRRLEGEPVAYLIGEWEFYGLPLSISPDVLIPRADTEVLAEQSILLARAAGAGARVLDLCAGSGCVGLAIAANSPGARVTLADLSPAALELCRSNARRNGLEERVACLQVDACTPNFLIQEHPGMAEGWDRGVGYLKKPFEIVNSYIDVPTAPGLGIEVNEDFVRENSYSGDWDTPRLFYEDGSVAQW